ncbi:MAG: Holliday junction branch migration DNA helicase RuvB [Phycisphaerales bacterium JB043]
MSTHRVLSATETGPEEEAFSRSLRPSCLDDFVGQRDLVERLRIAIQASRARGESMEHVMLHGPPGLGKTTLAHLIAHEMGSTAHITSGPALTRGSDLVGALTRLEAGDVLFIDEIHRLPVAVEEFIYPAMEDFRIDVAVDSGMHARTVSITLKPFTLIGATTRAGMVSAPLRSRFGSAFHLTLYDDDDLHRILTRSCRMLDIESTRSEVLSTIASRSRGTPRIANRLLRRVRDYAQVRATGEITTPVVEESLALEGVDALGLDALDRAYLGTIAGVYDGGPVGLEALAATLGEDSGTLEDVVEPFLLQRGLVARTRRGRELTSRGSEHSHAARNGSLFTSQSA